METKMPDFIKGLDLAEMFYRRVVADLLEKDFPGLSYSSGLLGFGSDVLGYDTEISRDHMWGPRLYLFLKEEERTNLEERIDVCLRTNLPARFRGYPVNFSNPDGEGVRSMEESGEGSVAHLIIITTPEEMVRQYLGPSQRLPITNAQWLTMGEHRLLAFTSGKLFRDDLGLEKIRKRYAAYPKDIRLFLMSSLWCMIGQKEAFLGRCGHIGDDLGSRLNGAAIVQYIMRLAFLWENKFAPYGKWFSHAFSQLESAAELKPHLDSVMASSDWKEREEHLCRAYVIAGQRQNELGFGDPVPAEITDYYGRPYRVIFAGRYGEALEKAIGDPRLRSLEKIGSVSHFTDVCQLYDNPELTGRMQTLYR